MDMHRQDSLVSSRFRRVLTPSSPDYCVDLTADSEGDIHSGRQHSISLNTPQGTTHSPQCSPDGYSGSLNRLLEQPVPVYAQSDAVFRACLHLQKYLIEPIPRQVGADMHPAEIHATHCLCSGEVKWADLLCIAQQLPHSKKPRFPQFESTGELPPVSFTTGACARGPNVGITRNMKDFPRVTQVLAMVIHAIDPEHRFSSCSLTLNMGASAHRDSHNARGSYNLLVPCSMFQGGGLWLQNDRGSVQLEPGGPFGSVMDVASPIRFRPLQQHATMPWHGNRLVLVAFHARHLSNLPVEDLVDLADCGFSLDPGLD